MEAGIYGVARLLFGCWSVYFLHASDTFGNSQKKGTLIQTPQNYNPYYGDPKKVPLILGNPHLNALETACARNLESDSPWKAGAAAGSYEVLRKSLQVPFEQLIPFPEYKTHPATLIPIFFFNLPEWGVFHIKGVGGLNIRGRG